MIILSNSECQAGKLAEELGKLQSHTSQQLNKLKMNGVIKSRRKDNKTYYALADGRIKRIVETVKVELSN